LVKRQYAGIAAAVDEIDRKIVVNGGIRIRDLIVERDGGARPVEQGKADQRARRQGRRSTRHASLLIMLRHFCSRQNRGHTVRVNPPTRTAAPAPVT
jgi:hypothetical protein